MVELGQREVRAERAVLGAHPPDQLRQVHRKLRVLHHPWRDHRGVHVHVFKVIRQVEQVAHRTVVATQRVRKHHVELRECLERLPEAHRPAPDVSRHGVHHKAVLGHSAAAAGLREERHVDRLHVLIHREQPVIVCVVMGLHAKQLHPARALVVAVLDVARQRVASQQSRVDHDERDNLGVLLAHPAAPRVVVIHPAEQFVVQREAGVALPHRRAIVPALAQIALAHLPGRRDHHRTGVRNVGVLHSRDVILRQSGVGDDRRVWIAPERPLTDLGSPEQVCVDIDDRVVGHVSMILPNGNRGCGDPHPSSERRRLRSAPTLVEAHR